MAEWISKNDYLSQTEMENNAFLFYSYMKNRGWTDNAISGALGCIQHESSINPGIWEGLVVSPERGFGLVQWTPSTNFTIWADSKGYSHTDGNAQCEWIDTQTGLGQWIETTSYPLSWEEFKSSTEPPGYLGYAWESNFERPGILYDPTDAANYWYEFLSGKPPDPSPGPGGLEKLIPDLDIDAIIQYGMVTKIKGGNKNGIYYPTGY